MKKLALCFNALVRPTCRTIISIRNYSKSTGNIIEEEKIINSEQNNAKELLKNSIVGNASHFESPEHLWESNPYKDDPTSKERRNQSRLFRKPNVSPKDTSILLFPGQGSQYVGMGKELVHFPLVQDLFEVASEILGYDLLKLCLEGPKEKLDKTVYCQPAIVVCSLAAIEKLRDERPQAIESCVAAAGFSIGEITALIFAGSLPYEQAMKIVKVRAEAMQLASEVAPSGMATVIYGPDSKLGYACLEAKEHCARAGVETPECKVANYLYPHCKVVAGHTQALDFLSENYKKFNLRRVKRLPVSGAFHSELMRPAVEPLRAALRRSNISDPLVSVHSNVDARRYANADHIKRQLPSQICKAVRWEQTLHTLYERDQGSEFPRTFECGPGRSLKTILKMVNAKASDSTLNVMA